MVLRRDTCRRYCPVFVMENNPYNLRTPNASYPLNANTTLFFNSFFPSIIHAWKELSEEIKEANADPAFKYRLNRNKRSPPKYYNVGTRIGQILHTRIRMECSSLNSHFFRKNIVASPTYDCGGFESPYHFFVCPRYIGIRNTSLSNIPQTHSTKELLLGKKNCIS